MASPQSYAGSILPQAGVDPLKLAEDRAKTERTDKKEGEKRLGEFLKQPDFSGVMPKDALVFANQWKDIVGGFSEFGKGDPNALLSSLNDPTSEPYQFVQKSIADMNAKMVVSKAQKDGWKKYSDLYNANPDKYTTDWMEESEKWKNTDFNERGEIPFLSPNINILEEMNALLVKNKPSSTEDVVIGTDIIKTTGDSEYSPEQKIEIASTVLSDPTRATIAANNFRKQPQEVQELYKAKGEEMGHPAEVLFFAEQIKGPKTHTEEAKGRTIPGGAGGAAAVSGAEWITEILRSAVNLDPNTQTSELKNANGNPYYIVQAGKGHKFNTTIINASGIPVQVTSDLEGLYVDPDTREVIPVTSADDPATALNQKGRRYAVSNLNDLGEALTLSAGGKHGDWASYAGKKGFYTEGEGTKTNLDVLAPALKEDMAKQEKAKKEADATVVKLENVVKKGGVGESDNAQFGSDMTLAIPGAGNQVFITPFVKVLNKPNGRVGFLIKGTGQPVMEVDLSQAQAFELLNQINAKAGFSRGTTTQPKANPTATSAPKGKTVAEIMAENRAKK